MAFHAGVSTPTPTPPPLTQQLLQPAGDQQQQQQGQFQPAHFQQYPRSYGQPFQPYDANQQQQQFQQQQQQFQQQYQQQQQVPVYVANALKAWVYTKLAMHAADIICCICAIALAFSINSDNESRYVFILCTPIFFFALIWDAAEIITWLSRKRVAGIHPGAHVGVSLIVWLGAAIVSGIQSAFVGYVVHGGSDTCWDADDQDYVDCGSPYGASAARFTAAAVFAGLVFLLHFTLFVGACVDTAKRNAARRRVMVVGPPYWGGPMAQGWQPMPQYYPQHQPPQSPGLQNMMNPEQQHMMAPGQQDQSIPLQDRSQGVEQTGYGKEGQSSTQPANRGVTEYYSPAETRT
ncbi:hypothetical protein QQX98_002463 [Neonectria punicea]|uniref:MARVEL domain-containing protein n=1 Tax=Neonectria punicea TaxID=979145 RepID=A0ABR1HIR9_9HYPO